MLICQSLAKDFSEAGLWTSELSENPDHPLFSAIDRLNSNDQKDVSNALAEVNAMMTFCMHPLGNKFSVGDLSLWGAIKGNPRVSGDVLNGKYPEIERWYKDYMEKQFFVSEVHEFIKNLNAV